jgi:hypothetical protein
MNITIKKIHETSINITTSTDSGMFLAGYSATGNESAILVFISLLNNIEVPRNYRKFKARKIQTAPQ